MPKRAGRLLAEATVERTTEAAGLRWAAAQRAHQSFGPAPDWAWHRDATGKTVAYGAGDATGVPQQGPQGAPAASRLATVAVIDTPVPDAQARWAPPATGREPVWQARDGARLAPWAELGATLWQQGVAVGIERAERGIALSAGGSGLEEFLPLHFPRVAAVILDFYPAAEPLSDWATAWPGADAHAAAAVGHGWCHQLKHEGGQAVLATLRGLDLQGRSPAAHECYQETGRYVANQVHRRDYPYYRAQGWPIGSGPVESACKRVVGQRLKGAGMRWGEEGAEAVCRLRALFLSEPGQWDAFWSHN